MFRITAENNLILAVDIGTSETKAALVGTSGLIGSTNRRYGLEYPKLGWVEQDSSDISDAIYGTIRELIRSYESFVENIQGITFTSQMQGLLPLDVEGKPVNGIKMLTWMDTRAAEITKSVMFKGWPRIQGYPMGKLLKFLKITGGAPGFTGKDTICKIYWLKENRPEIYEKTHKFVDTKDFAVNLATGKFITSVDMAYITWLMDTREGRFQWSEEICDMYDLDINKLCEILPSAANLGKITTEFAKRTGLNSGIQVINGSGDLLTSAIGSGAIKRGEIHANVGTAGWIGCHYPKKVKDIKHYTGTIASGIPETYFIVCKQETLGGAFDWVKKMLYPEELTDEISPQEIYKKIEESVNTSPPGANNLIFTPWLLGERSPINDPYLRGQIYNIGMYNSRADIFRASFEGIAFNLLWGIEVVENLAGLKSKTVKPGIRVIGGATKSDIWCQIFADVWQRKIWRMKDPQMASAIGAAAIAMVSLGIIENFSRVDELVKIDREFKPNLQNERIYNEIFEQYKKIYKKNSGIFMKLNSES
ncbi:MAG: xylulokinase [Promethearchaeota archaeon]